jgi:hypothetical protein
MEDDISSLTSQVAQQKTDLSERKTQIQRMQIFLFVLIIGFIAKLLILKS